MKKRIKKWGNSLVILFSKEETKIYNLNENDILDIEIVKVKEVKNGL